MSHPPIAKLKKKQKANYDHTVDGSKPTLQSPVTVFCLVYPCFIPLFARVLFHIPNGGSWGNF